MTAHLSDYEVSVVKSYRWCYRKAHGVVLLCVVEGGRVYSVGNMNELSEAE